MMYPMEKGTQILNNGDKYIGDFKFGSRDGQGVLTYANGDKYRENLKKTC